ncbi:Sn1-specific diacylglycerol lipase [Rhynchospora pubera]|uniref:Sn1-specific diacylglycerol lipase n=1 Tax=Rhynchospora pubera TaxID=906938 RepID=A0AAV8CQA8_9POAL|nr:Sn1-specific diacylglycerol lipase [Rhynchospora pubera]
MLTVGPILHTLRVSTLISSSLNTAVAVLGGLLLSSMLGQCRRSDLVSTAGAAIASVAKLVCMIGGGVTQGVVASTIAGRSIGAPFDPDRHFHLVARTRYKRWLWWTRLGIAVTIIQFAMAVYLLVVVANDLSSGVSHKSCFSGKTWKHNSIIALLVITWVVVIMQCFSGSDVLRWRSFYSSHDTAWQVHYREVFDHGIREVLCCLGRAKYMSVMGDDEVYMVARLLGDLMAYRALGTGHLELLAGLALLQKHKPTAVSYDDHVEAPYMRMKEASFFHQFAEAAYTGPLLDLGRHPLLFPCVWIYRQGTFTPWTRNRRPFLEGDNCWRGHAAAFLKYVNLPPDTLRKGRVRQAKREAAYFVVVLHDLKAVVIAVRGTETPEDLITDSLWGECALNMDDLDGLINSNNLDPSVKEKLQSSFPRFGHSGIIESARELYIQINGNPLDGDKSELNGGCISSLLGEGCECYGYRIRIVGHSLGGSVAAVLGILLYGQYPNLHVYSYGALPCLDPILAEACSHFVTSIVYNDEFSARLSMNSIMRLRAAAVRALSSNTSANMAMLPNLVRRIVHIRKDSTNVPNQLSISPVVPVNSIMVSENSDGQIHNRHLAHTIRGGVFLCGHAMSCMMHSDSHHYRSSSIEEISANGLAESSNGQRLDLSLNPREEVQASITNSSGVQSAEVYLPGLVVHLVRVQRGGQTNPILTRLKPFTDRHSDYKAFVVNRERFVDILVSPYMFLDHLPWRCQYALLKVLESRKEQPDLNSEEMNV